MIELPWPSSALAGHSSQHYRHVRPIIKQHREWAKLATQALGPFELEGTSDIRVIVTFYPSNNRGDRCNYPNRMKPYFDGIADGLGVNDKRFLPSYHFAETVEHGKVVVVIEACQPE